MIELKKNKKSGCVDCSKFYGIDTRGWRDKPDSEGWWWRTHPPLKMKCEYFDNAAVETWNFDGMGKFQKAIVPDYKEIHPAWEPVELKNDIRVDFHLVWLVFKNWIYRKCLTVTLHFQIKGEVKVPNAQIELQPYKKER